MSGFSGKHGAEILIIPKKINIMAPEPSETTRRADLRCLTVKGLSAEGSFLTA